MSLWEDEDGNNYRMLTLGADGTCAHSIQSTSHHWHDLDSLGERAMCCWVATMPAYTCIWIAPFRLQQPSGLESLVCKVCSTDKTVQNYSNAMDAPLVRSLYASRQTNTFMHMPL